MKHQLVILLALILAIAVDGCAQPARHADTAVSRAALFALSNVQHPEIRELALEMLAAPSGPNSDCAVALLTSNYRPEDGVLIAERLEREQDADRYHGLGLDAIRVFKANPTVEGAPILMSLYEEGSCAICREDCIELLHAWGQLPDWIMRECLFDANPDLRSKAYLYQKRNAG